LIWLSKISDTPKSAKRGHVSGKPKDIVDMVFKSFMHYRQDLEEKTPIMWREHYANYYPPTYVCKKRKKGKTNLYTQSLKD
jgi:hypothetical protein